MGAGALPGAGAQQGEGRQARLASRKEGVGRGQEIGLLGKDGGWEGSACLWLGSQPLPGLGGAMTPETLSVCPICLDCPCPSLSLSLPQVHCSQTAFPPQDSALAMAWGPSQVRVAARAQAGGRGGPASHALGGPLRASFIPSTFPGAYPKPELGWALQSLCWSSPTRPSPPARNHGCHCRLWAGLAGVHQRWKARGHSLRLKAWGGL